MFRRIVNQVMRRFREEKGQGMVEYGIVLALVAMIGIGAFTILGQKASGGVTNQANVVGNTLNPQAPGGGTGTGGG